MGSLDDKLLLEDMKIIFRNFSGQVSQFNAEGKRNFCVLLDPKKGEKLKKDGWNVRTLEGRAEGDEPQAYMQVAVSYDNYPPQITLVTSKNKNIMQLDDIGLLDFAEITNVDLVIRPYEWDVNGKQGVKAYLKSAYITIEEDEFAEKYQDIGKIEETLAELHQSPNPEPAIDAAE